VTKERQPLTFERALMRIAGQIGMDGCAQILGKSESAVRKLSDPDIEREISMRDARRLDAAYQRAGGAGAPLLECYALQLEMGGDENRASLGEMIAAAGDAARETGEAIAAAMAAIERHGDRRLLTRALLEIEEGVASLTAMAARLGGSDYLGGQDEQRRSV